MADNYGVGALGGVVLVDPDTGLPYKATGGGGGGGAVDSVNGQTGTVVLDAGDVEARADNWVPTIEDVPNLENSLDTLANDISVAPYVVAWTTQDQVRPDTDRVVWWVGDLEFPPDNAIETDIVTRT